MVRSLLYRRRLWLEADFVLRRKRRLKRGTIVTKGCHPPPFRWSVFRGWLWLLHGAFVARPNKGSEPELGQVAQGWWVPRDGYLCSQRLTRVFFQVRGFTHTRIRSRRVGNERQRLIISLGKWYQVFCCNTLDWQKCLADVLVKCKSIKSNCLQSMSVLWKMRLTVV